MPSSSPICAVLALVASARAYSLGAAMPSAVRAHTPAMVAWTPTAVASPAAASAHLTHSSSMRGHFDNHAQVTENEAAGLTPRHGGGHEHIHCALRHGLEATATARQQRRQPGVATYTSAGREYVFRERLYKFDAIAEGERFGTCLRMSIYKLREVTTTPQRGGAARRWTTLPSRRRSLRSCVPEADVFWRWCGERFEEMRAGHRHRLGHSSARSSSVTTLLGWTRCGQRPRARRRDGEYVYGNIHNVPYKMRRVADDHWTSRVDLENPNPSV